MNVQIAPNQSIDVVQREGVEVTREPTKVSAKVGKALLQLQNTRGPIVVEVPGNGADEETEEGDES